MPAPKPTDVCGADKEGKAVTVQRSICAYIRAGAFPELAAEAAGITRELYRLWMERGGRTRARQVYRDFRQAVLQAQAQARVNAEIAVHTDRPLEWLTRGPGKETPELAGWSQLVKPVIALNDNRTINLLTDPTVAAMLQLLLAALAPYPDARKAVIAALNAGAEPPPLKRIGPVAE